MGALAVRQCGLTPILVDPEPHWNTVSVCCLCSLNVVVVVVLPNDVKGRRFQACQYSERNQLAHFA